MTYANWKDELAAFEKECDAIRKSRRSSFPVKILGLAPLGSLLFFGGMTPLRRIVAGAGILISGTSLLMELEQQRANYGGNLAIDLNPNSDYDNLAEAFRTRSPRWRALSYIYSQLDPLSLKDRLSQLSDDSAKRVLDRMIRRATNGLREITAVPSHRANYSDIVLSITEEWRGDVVAILDRALFSSGVATADDVELEDDELLEDEAGDPAEVINPSDTPIASAQPLKLFDWGDIQQHPDRYPHLLLLGKTGAGKTWLGERLLALLGGDALVIHPHAAPRDFAGYQVIGGGRNYPAITAAIDRLHSEMNLRYQRRDKGDEGYRPLTVLIDEFPSIAHFCGKDVIAQILALVREARKVQIRLVILSQGAEVKALGIEGQGSVRECFTFIRLKGFAEDFARKQGDTVYTWVGGQRFPCMVEDSPADSSVLAALEKPASGVLDGWMDGSGGGQNGAISAQNSTNNPSNQQSIQPVGNPVESEIQQSNNPSNNIQQPTPIHPTTAANPTIHPTASNSAQQPLSDVSPIDWDSLWRDINSKAAQSQNTPDSGDSSLTPKAGQLLEWVKRRGGSATIREAIQHRGFGDRPAIDGLVQELENRGLVDFVLEQQKITVR